MGLLELVVVIGGAVVSAGLAVAARTFDSKTPREPEPRAKLPLLWLLVGVGGLAAAPVIGSFVAPHWISYVGSTVPSDVVLISVGDPWVPAGYAFVASTTLAAVPGGAFVLWLVASNRRSPIMALVFAGAATGCCAFAVALAFSAVEAALHAMVDMSSGDGFSGIEMQLSLRSVVRQSAWMSLGLGVCGAAVGAVAVTAASSTSGVRVALWASVAVPFGVALVAAVTTPPDPTSQLVFIASVLGCWLLGLGLGAAVRYALSKRTELG